MHVFTTTVTDAAPAEQAALNVYKVVVVGVTDTESVVAPVFHA